jgi:hypothetical protein
MRAGEARKLPDLEQPLSAEGTDGDQLPSPTAPERLQISLKGFADESGARAFGETLGTFARVISRYIDLSNLDGITVAFDYPAALAELDRGYENSIVGDWDDESIFKVLREIADRMLANGGIHLVPNSGWRILRKHSVLARDHAGGIGFSIFCAF